MTRRDNTVKKKFFTNAMLIIEELRQHCLNNSIYMRRKTPELFEKPPLSKAGKHPDFQVTSCHHFDTTNVDFAYIESE
jgi:hypothetical protein